MASVSHTARGRPSASVVAVSISTGTLPVGVAELRVCLNCDPGANESNRTTCSVNGMPACFSSTQGRMDQEE